MRARVCVRVRALVCACACACVCVRLCVRALVCACVWCRLRNTGLLTDIVLVMAAKASRILSFVAKNLCMSIDSGIDTDAVTVAV